MIAPLLAVPALALWACSGGDAPAAPEGTAGAIPTATPYAVLPQATIVAVAGPPTPAPTPTPRPGQTPTPTATPQPVTHRVASGDNPSTIASRYGVTVSELLRANGITDPTSLQVGQVLVIPGQFIEPTPAATSTATATATATATTTATPTRTPGAGGGDEVYIVQSGDTASDIANRYGITVAELAQANGTTEAALRNLQVGQRLVIPR